MFYMFYVAELFVECALAEGEEVIGEIGEHLRAGEVVSRERFGDGAFWGVGEDEDRDAASVFDRAQSPH